MKRKKELESLGAAAAGAGAAGMAALAGACCVPVISPLIISVLGVSGAVWAAGLRPYSWWILASAGVLLAAGFRVVYLREARSDGACPATRARLPRVVLWTALAVWLLALLLNVADTTAVFAQEPKDHAILDQRLEPFRSRFNAASDHVRAVLLVGPT